MTLKFDPNNQKPPHTPEWATYAPGRKAKWKLHTNLGHAKNAFYAQWEIILYRHEDGRWVEKYRKEGPWPEECEQCGANLMEESRYSPGTRHNHGGWLWAKDKELSFIRVCRKCELQIRYPKMSLPKYL